MITDYFMITEKSNRLQVIMITDYDYTISGCNTSISKRCHGNDNANVMLHSLSFDTFYMYLLSATENKTTDPK